MLCNQVDIKIHSITRIWYYSACHTAPIIIEDPNVDNDNSLTLTWSTPPSVMSQGVEQYVIDVLPRCQTGENTVNSQQFVRSPIQAPRVMVTNLRKWCTNNVEKYCSLDQFSHISAEPFTPFQIRMSAIICQTPVEVYNKIVYTREGKLFSGVVRLHYGNIIAYS